MAEQKPAAGKPAEPKAEAAPEPARAPLGSAGASSSPLVHQLLAERIIAASPGVEDKAAVAAIDEKLAGLGVSVDA